ncbi:MAG: hypothetical protein AB7G44_00475 [Bacteroidia bacterium]
MKHFILLLFCGLFSAGASAQIAPAATGILLFSDDSLDSYLSDTVHAAKHIRELVHDADKISRETQSSEAIKLFLLALELEEFAKDSIALRIDLHNRFSARLAIAEAMELSLEHAKASLQLAKNIRLPYSGVMYNQCAKIASIYANMSVPDSALYYYRQAIDEAEKEGEYLWTASGWNNLGVFFSKRNKADSAQSCYNKALSILKLNFAEDTVLLRSIRDNIAMEAAARNDFKTAISNYELNLELTKARKDTSSLLQTLYGLANIYLSQEKIDKSKACLDEAELLLTYYRNTRYFERKLQLAELWIRYYESTGNLKPALEKQRWLLNARDSIADAKSKFIKEIILFVTQKELSIFKKSMRISELELQSRQAELAHAKSRERRNMVGIFLSLCIMVLGYLYWRNRSKRQENLLELNRAKLNLSEATLLNEQLEKEKMEQELRLKESELRNEQLEKEKIEQELKFKKGDLSDLAIYLGNLKNLNTKMVDKLNEAKKNNIKDVKDLVREINTELGSQLQSDKKIRLIQENIESVNKEFYDKLNRQFPTLTKSEIELCGLLRLNLSNKEIGDLKSISPESAKKARQRMRKKLKIAPEQDIYQFLSAI